MRENTAWTVRLGLVERAKRVLGIVLLSTFASLPAWSQAVEKRCQELGASGACSCSDTYDSPTFTTGIGGSNNANSDASPAATECHDATGNWYPASALSIVDETGMPAGNTVSKVFKNNQSCGPQVSSGNQMKSNTKRICIRSYQKLSADYYNGNTSGGKWIEMTWDINHSMQYGHNGWGPNNHFSCRIIWDRPIFNCAQTGELTAPECLGEWCRVEMCIEGDFVNETGNFYLEGYWERARDHKRRSIPYQLMGTSTSNIPEGIPFIWPVDGFRGCDAPGQGCDPSEATCKFSGNREISHVMQAEWPFQQQGLFIGAAYEVEGGDPGTTTTEPPPPTTEPPPPTTEPPPPNGSLSLTASAAADVGGVRVTSVVSGGTGPYQYLFDCNQDGNWDGVVNSSQSTASHTCTSNGQSVQDMTAWAWDQTTNAVGQVLVRYSSSTSSGVLGAPGRPYPVLP